MEESNDDFEIVDKILSFYRESFGEIGGGDSYWKFGIGKIKVCEVFGFFFKRFFGFILSFG